jgi:hypothetical protein
LHRKKFAVGLFALHHRSGAIAIKAVFVKEAERTSHGGMLSDAMKWQARMAICFALFDWALLRKAQARKRIVQVSDSS